MGAVGGAEQASVFLIDVCLLVQVLVKLWNLTEVSKIGCDISRMASLMLSRYVEYVMGLLSRNLPITYLCRLRY